jgi:hypothetical protein
MMITELLYMTCWRTRDWGIGGLDWPVELFKVANGELECASSDFDATSRCPARAHYTQRISRQGEAGLL